MGQQFDNTAVACLLHHLVVELLILGNSATHHKGSGLPIIPCFSISQPGSWYLKLGPWRRIDDDVASCKETKQTTQSVCLYLRISVVVADHSVPDPSVNTDTVFIRAINIFTEDPQN